MATDAFEYGKKLLDGTGASPERSSYYYAQIMTALGYPTIVRCSDNPIAALELIAALTVLLRQFAQQHEHDPTFVNGFSLIGQRG